MLPEEPNPMDEVLVVAPISSYQLLENEVDSQLELIS